MTYSELKERYLVMYNWATQESDDNGKVYTEEVLDDEEEMDGLEAELDRLGEIEDRFNATLTEEDKETLIQHAGGLKKVYKEKLKYRMGLFQYSFFGALVNVTTFIFSYYFAPRRFREWLVGSATAEIGVELEKEGKVG